MTAGRVILWRHGRTDHNRSARWQGQIDVPLDETGLRQAFAAAAVLAPALAAAREVGEPVRLVCSDLSRARDTAAALERATGLSATPDERLREIHAGAWQGLDRQEIVAAGMGAMLEAWGRGEDVAVGGGERRSEAGARAATTVLEHAGRMDGGVLVVAAHGGVLRGAALTLMGLPPGEWELLGGLANCAWGELGPARSGSAWRLLSWNVTAGERAG
ncbi:MAG: histidine phosphatase family protein [Kineosporiaceae bacterium]